jgi:SAM-dependent methyltransferase
MVPSPPWRAEDRQHSQSARSRAAVITRRAVRRLFDSIGVLDLARETRDSVLGLSWLRDNSTFWRRGADDGLPTPPLRLVRLATGTSSLSWYFEGGELAANSIRGVLEKNRIDMRQFEAILDFGCGCARVVRHWAGLTAAVHGCDYNPGSVTWCRRNLPFATFDVNRLEPPLPYADAQFDLVYALSVFTHTPEPLLLPWMRDLWRVLRPGGFLIVTTHGEAYLGELTVEEQGRFRSGRPVAKHEDAGGTNRCGVYFSDEYIRTRFADGFRVLDFLPQGAKGNPHQDLVLLQKMAADG